VATVAEHLPKFDKYDVLEEIGHGGMATVYRARDRRLGRDVAIKVIHRHLRENQEVAARFVAEARAVAKLKHPSIVEVYDVSDEAEPERYLIVELVPGTTLRKLISERGHMPAEIAAAVGIEIGSALDHAHQQGVVHRDVKPENVLVDLSERSPSARGNSQERPADAEAGRVKITDFGIAKLLDAQGVTSTGQVLGSPAHMAPEQIEGGDVTARADVFGMGVLLYECMVGRLPFDGKNPAQVLRKVLDGTFTPPERARPSVGAGFSRVVEKALARESADRYESCAELCEALRTELDALGFDNPRRELSEYLTSPKSYDADYEKRIVGRLVQLGKKARAARQPPLAAAYLNRALAFRPDDAELLRQVAGLAQAERLKRLGTRAGAVFGIALVFGLGAYGASRQLQHPKPVASSDAPVAPSTIRAEDPKEPKLAPSASAAPPSSALVQTDDKKDPKPKLVPVPSPSAGKPNGTRKVSIGPGSGPMPSSVLMDGVPIDWFGVKELPVGTHSFVFTPPNKTCCADPQPRVINITPGDTVMTISANIAFKEAMLTLSGPPGTTASCPNLLGGAPMTPGTRKLKLTAAKQDTCVINGPPEGSKPQVQTVNLRPGDSVSLSWNQGG